MLEKADSHIGVRKNRYIGSHLPKTTRSDFNPVLFAYICGFSLAMMNSFAQVFGFIGRSYDTPLDYILLTSAPVAFLFASFVHLQTRQLRDFRAVYRQWISVLLIVFFILLAMGITKGNTLRVVGQDVVIWIYIFASMLIGVRSENWDQLDRVLLVWFGISTLASMWFWLKAGLLTNITNRSVLTTSSSYQAWNLLFSWPYLMLTMSHRKQVTKLLIGGGFAVFIILSVVFQKRTSLVQVVVLFVLYMYMIAIKKRSLFNKQILKLLATTIAILALIWGMAYLVGITQYQEFLVQVMQQRFTGETYTQQSGSVINTILSNDRLSEPSLFMKEATDVEIIFGKGMGGVMLSAAMQGEVGVVHNGLVNVVLKGGILLAIIWMFGWGYLVLDGLRNRDEAMTRYYIPVIILGVSAVIGFGNILQSYPATCFIMLCAGRCMAKVKDPINSKAGFFKEAV